MGNNKPTKSPDRATGLRELFLMELKDMYWAEQALVVALKEMQQNAGAEELATALEEHRVETEAQITRLEEVFVLFDEKPEAMECEAMKGLIRETAEMMDEIPAGVVRDAAIISCAQKVEHYEIATYGTMIAFAEVLKAHKVVAILAETLMEEKETDQILTNLAVSVINAEANDEAAE
jgi:ferritin-like metal-binding protein YciE